MPIIQSNLVPTQSSRMPGFIAPVVQDANYQRYFGDITAYGDEGDDFLTMPSLTRVHTPAAVRQHWSGGVDPVEFVNGMLYFPFYTIQARANYTDIDQARFEKEIIGVGLPTLLEYLAESGIRQKDHQNALFGLDSQANQGIARMGTAVAFPADPDGNQTVISYNTSSLFNFILAQTRSILDNTYSMANPAVIASSPRIINYINSAIINLTDYQAPGGGSGTIGSTFETIQRMINDRSVILEPDMMLQGTGTGGADIILFIAPGVSEQQRVEERYSQYRWAGIQNGGLNTFKNEWGGGIARAINPTKDRTTAVNYWLKTTPGVTLRPETVIRVDVQYQ